MTPTFSLILVLAVLGPFVVISAQESSSAPQSGNETETSAAPQDESSTTHMASDASGLFGHFALSNFNWPPFPGADFFSGGSREKRSPASSRRVRCNFRRQGRAMCTSCTTSRRCNRNNRGREITCNGEYPYCRNGRCSKRMGYLCRKNSTSTTTSDDDENGSDSSSSSTSRSSSSSSSDSSGSSSTSSSTSSDDDYEEYNES